MELTENFMEKKIDLEHHEEMKKLKSMMKLVPNEMTPIILEDLQEMFAQ